MNLQLFIRVWKATVALAVTYVSYVTYRLIAQGVQYNVWSTTQNLCMEKILQTSVYCKRCYRILSSRSNRDKLGIKWLGREISRWVGWKFTVNRPDVSILIFWNCFESTDFNCILLFVFLIILSSIVVWNQNWQFFNCATLIAFSERYEVWLTDCGSYGSGPMFLLVTTYKILSDIFCRG